MRTSSIKLSSNLDMHAMECTHIHYKINVNKMGSMMYCYGNVTNGARYEQNVLLLSYIWAVRPCIKPGLRLFSGSLSPMFPILPMELAGKPGDII